VGDPPRRFGLALVLSLGAATGAAVGVGLWLGRAAPFVGQLVSALAVAGGAVLAVALVLVVVRPGLAWGDLGRYGLGVALLGAAAFWYWAQWHETLWVDNGTPAPVTVRLAGRALGVVAPGAPRAFVVPRLAGALEALGPDGAVVERVAALERAEREEWSLWVLNVGGTHCYVVDWGQYGEGPGIGWLAGGPQLIRRRYFSVRADYMFTPLPEEILVKQHGRSSLPHFRQALRIVPCPERGGRR
jgi:hypothetical protein